MPLPSLHLPCAVSNIRSFWITKGCTAWKLFPVFCADKAIALTEFSPVRSTISYAQQRRSSIPLYPSHNPPYGLLQQKFVDSCTSLACVLVLGWWFKCRSQCPIFLAYGIHSYFCVVFDCVPRMLTFGFLSMNICLFQLKLLLVWVSSGSRCQSRVSLRGYLDTTRNEYDTVFLFHTCSLCACAWNMGCVRHSLWIFIWILIRNQI